MTIGEKLQARRKDLKLTQEVAAKQLHVSRQAISNWETGKNYPDLETIITISDVYSISLDTLLKGDKLIVKEINKTIYTSIIKRGIAFLGLLSIVVCLIIDLGISLRITWSLVPLISIGSLALTWLTFDRAKTHKVIKSAICFSLLLVPYLWLLEQILVTNHYVKTDFFSLALPITLIWLAILWISIIVQIKLKWHWCYTVALFCLAAIGGSYLMGIVIGETDNQLSLIITTISTGSTAVVFFFLGNFLSQLDQKNKQ